MRTKILAIVSRVFSEMAFGELFSVWLIFTAIITYHRGFMAFVVSSGIYLTLFMGLLATGHLLSRSDPPE
ncbi:hypothetical protein Pan44_11580 [Caulifigura coniformis]|uniref:Uncharacterized protein n=1 Tax=Caulifigura coniformis TaxID=2527983 RepID=A0A517SAK1_9PLAN|nr:hypothetical protein [Caulifigura coniformis]QDT53143.1 hypothetical protein Pan44_11580 [Caulifigura coniformis]